MTQPKFAPILLNAEVRHVAKLPAPAPWQASRPADWKAAPGAARALGRGAAGPDQGYGMLLAERFADRIRLTDGEHLDDVLLGASVVAMRRAAFFGRAPVGPDLELVLNLFGFLGEATAEQAKARRALFGGVAHDYWRQRELADQLPEETLRMSPAALSAQLSEEPSSFGRLAGLEVPAAASE